MIVYYLAYEVPGDGEDAWVVRREDDGEISNPIDVHPTLSEADVPAAKQWANAVTDHQISEWTRVLNMDWTTYQAELAAPNRAYQPRKEQASA